METNLKYSYLQLEYSHAVAATFATLLAHPIRVGLNRSAYDNSFSHICKTLPLHWYKGLSINIARGISTVTAQSWLKTKVQKKLGQNNPYAFLSGCMAASLAGTTVALSLESLLILKTTHIHNLKIHALIPLVPINLALVSAYFIREFTFSLSVLGKKDVPSHYYYPMLFTSTGISAIAHKFASWEATANVIEQTKQGRVPHFSKDGIVITLKLMTRGDVYSHSACAVPFYLPKNTWERAVNFLSMSCGSSMFTFRFLYLFTYGNLFHYGFNKYQQTFFSPPCPNTNKSLMDKKSNHDESFFCKHK